MTEKDEWGSLLTHPGFLRLLERARQEWVVGYPQKVKLAIAKARADKTDLGAAVAEVDAANEAINALLSWPATRQRQCEAHMAQDAQPPSQSRC